VATALAGFVVLGLGHGLAAIVLGVVLAAVGEGVVLPPVAAWAGDLAPMKRRGAVMGGLVTATDIGAAVGPVAAYALSGSLGLRGVYAMCAVIFAAALVLLAVTRPVRRTVSPGEPLDEPVTP
jgi:MFS family permease